MKKRVLSAVVILLIAIPILLIGGIVYNIGVLILGLFALKEFLDIKETKRKIPYIVKLITYLLFTTLLLNNAYSKSLATYLDYKIIGSIVFLLLLPLIYYKNNEKYNINHSLSLIGIVFFLGLSFNLLIIIRNYNLMYLIFLLIITIMSDTFAYITGYYIGKTPLLKEFSPKKTWEGLIGGTFFGVFISSLFYLSVINNNIGSFDLALIITFLSIIGQTGDLIFSSIKRYYGKKDFSNLIPGHGGILDRLDSILFVVLAFTLIIEFINI